MTLREQAKLKVRQNIEKILMDFHNQRCADMSGAVDCIFLNFEEYLSLLSKEGKELPLVNIKQVERDFPDDDSFCVLDLMEAAAIAQLKADQPYVTAANARAEKAEAELARLKAVIANTSNGCQTCGYVLEALVSPSNKDKE